MIKITLPDGSIKQVESGTSAMDIAMDISEGLARNVLSASVNGEVWDANRPITTDSTLTLHTFNDKEGKSTFWHSSAHYGRSTRRFISWGKTRYWSGY